MVRFMGVSWCFVEAQNYAVFVEGVVLSSFWINYYCLVVGHMKYQLRRDHIHAYSIYNFDAFDFHELRLCSWRVGNWGSSVYCSR
jgi:hypothetical protein